MEAVEPTPSITLAVSRSYWYSGWNVHTNMPSDARSQSVRAASTQARRRAGAHACRLSDRLAHPHLVPLCGWGVRRMQLVVAVQKAVRGVVFSRSRSHRPLPLMFGTVSPTARVRTGLL